ncbi:hypothetical protein KFE25_000662 [Diacronema lutheri]|uniref:Protein kinase domain-containing protein n=2 Tax=Diacronema lutheri TaxID=2081491 RepID=A0A8J6CDR0_DIALT|nr:hypothetical protein KFE25_000662 [Diacronema lutheri]
MTASVSTELVAQEDAEKLAYNLDKLLTTNAAADSFDAPDDRSLRMSDEERVLNELALIVNSKAYRARGPSRNLSVSLPHGVVPDAAHDIETDETRINSGVDKVAALAHTEQHLDPSTDLVNLASLGEGAFAVVELCKTTKHHVFPKGSYAARTGLVACKRLKPECIAEEPLEFDNFMTEAALVKMLVHKNVIECYGCIEYRDKRDGMHCVMILLEYLQGGSLRARIAKRDYTGEQAIRWLREIAEGMSYLHSVAKIGVAHRDLKPDNILLDEFGVAKIADMGMARIAMRATSGEINHVDLDQNYSSAAAPTSPALARKPSFSVTCRTGTPRYMAPENWAGSSYTYKVDVFSFSILAFEVLSGQRAYGELMMNGQALADAVAESGLRPSLPPAWPQPLRDLLSLCWAQEAEARPDFPAIVVKLRVFEENAKLDPTLLAPLIGGNGTPSMNRRHPTTPGADKHGPAAKHNAAGKQGVDKRSPPGKQSPTGRQSRPNGEHAAAQRRGAELESGKKKTGHKSSSMCLIS